MSDEIVFEVPPLSRISIRHVAHLIRNFQKQVTGADEPWFPVVDFLEFTMPKIDSEFVLDIRTMNDMGDNMALAMPSEHEIWVREDVWEGANQDNGRDRGVLAHEVGHYFLHPNVGMARRISAAAIPAYRSSEWQAKAFQGELLVCTRHVGSPQTAFELVEKFGVSFDSAQYQMGVYRREGLIKI